MFLFAPCAQAVLRVDGERNTFYPVRSVVFESEKETDSFLVDPASILMVGEKETVKLDSSLNAKAASIAFIRAVGPSGVTIGWAFGFALRESRTGRVLRFYISDLRPAAKTINPKDTVVWLFMNNAEAFSDRADRVFDQETTAGTAGDLICRTLTFDLDLATTKRLSMGLNGVASLSFETEDI